MSRIAALLVGAIALAANALAFDVQEIAPGVFVHAGPHEEATPENLGAFANHGFIIGEESVAVFDPGGSLLGGLRLLDAVRTHTALPVRYVVATHDHPDHSFGAAAFTEAEFIGHGKLADALERRGRFLLERTLESLGAKADGTRLVMPSRTIAAGEILEIDLGQRVLRLRAWPTAHTDNDVTVFDETTRTLFLGDLLFVDRVPIVDGSLLGWLDVLEQLQAIGAARVVPGHGPASAPWPQAMEAQLGYLEQLRDDVRAAIVDDTPMLDVVQAASEQRNDAFVLFEQYHARNVTTAYKELEWE